MSYINRLSQARSVDSNNSSTATLGPGSTFTGTSTSTLGFGTMQISFKADTNCTIYIDQSPDNSNWDVTDTYLYYPNVLNFSVTTQCVSSYYRVRVTNNSPTITNTYLRLQSILLPIGNSLPRSVDSEGALSVCLRDIEDPFTGNRVWTDDFHALRTNPTTRLIGTPFVGNTKDTNFWAETDVNGGTVTQSGGAVVLATNTTSAATVQYQTVRLARWVTGAENTFRAVLKVGDTGATNNTRNWGAFNSTDGFFFQLTGTTFNIVSRLASADTAVAEASWNYQNSFVLDTNYHLYEIKMTYKGIYYYIDGLLVHQLIPTTTFFSQTLNLPVTLQNNNGAITVNHTMTAGVAFITRTGELNTESAYSHITAAATTILKYGAGRLHKIVINNPANSNITVYDNITNSGTIIGIMNINTSATTNPFYIDYDCPFNNGLTIVTSATIDITVIYE
jgi:hypothetical protein